MPRINIEDTLYRDSRFLNLVIKLGDCEKAVGAMVMAWSLAQAYFLDESNDRMIPFNEWKRKDINPEIINCGLAELKNDHVYVCGAEDQFSWLLQRSAAGRKSGESKRRNNSKASNGRTTVVNGTTTPVNGSIPLPLPLSPTSKEVVVEQPPQQKTENDLSKKEASIIYNPNNSSNKFKERFEVALSDKEKWVNILGDDFKSFIYHLPRLVKHFKTEQDFEKFCDFVSNSEKGKKLKGDDLLRYVKGALSSELGLKVVNDKI